MMGLSEKALFFKRYVIAILITTIVLPLAFLSSLLISANYSYQSVSGPFNFGYEIIFSLSGLVFFGCMVWVILKMKVMAILKVFFFVLYGITVYFLGQYSMDSSKVRAAGDLINDYYPPDTELVYIYYFVLAASFVVAGWIWLHSAKE